MESNFSIRKLAIMAILTGILFTFELALSAVPFLQITQFLIIVYVFTIGFKETLVIVIAHTLLDNLVMGSLNLIYTPAMLIGWIILVLVTRLINKKDPVLLGFIAFVHAFIYSFLFMVVTVWIFGNNNPIPYIISDIPFAVGMGVSGFFTVLFLFKPIVKTLDRLLSNELS